jgi:hypothetical protein
MDEEGLIGKATDPHFSTLIQQFADSLDAVQEVAEVVSEPIEQLDSTKEFSVRLGVPASMVGPFRQLLDSHREGNGDEPYGDAEEGASSPIDASELMEDLEGLFEDHPGVLRQFVDMFHRRPPRRGNLVRSSLLVTAMSAFETLVAGLATQHYMRFPSALGGAEKEFSLQDLKALGSIEDARDVVIARKVETLLFGSLTDWAEWFGRRLRLDAVELAADWPTLFEAMQRRHVIIHSASRVSRLYVQRMSEYGEAKAAIGDELIVGADYLAEALSQLRVFGVRLAIRCWASWTDESVVIAGRFAELIYDALLKEQWAVACELAEDAQVLSVTERDVQTARCNCMIARAEMLGLDSVRDEVEAWDVSALSPEFRMAKAALLRHHDDVAIAIPSLFRADLLGLRQVDEWPLLRHFRADERFPDVRAALLEQIERGKAAEDEPARSDDLLSSGEQTTGQPDASSFASNDAASAIDGDLVDARSQAANDDVPPD